MSNIVNSILGTSGQAINFNAAAPNLVQPTTAEQAGQTFGNTQTGLSQQQAFLQALQQQNGIQNQANVYNQLAGVAQGTGPNPAQAMLNNTAGQNVANQAALMAGQRGSGANAGLLARQAAQQGSAIQQQAAGQGAALQAQQSLNAINQMGGIAGQQVGQQQNANNAYNQAALQGQSNILGGIGNQNQANVAATGNQNSTNAAIQGVKAGQQANMFGNLTGAAGSVLQNVPSLFSQASPATGAGTLSAGAGDALTTAAPLLLAAEGGAIKATPMSRAAKYFANGGSVPAKVPAMVSKGEQYLDKKAVSEVKKGADPLKVGEKIPGKPEFKGNDYRNDVVPKTLEEGGLVIPNEVMQSKDPHKEAAKFVAAHLKSLKKGK